MPGWRFIGAGLLIVASTYGLARYTYGLFLPEIQAELGLSASLAGLIAAGSYAGYLLATLAGSVLSGITGPRLPVVAGGAAATGGMVLISSAGDPWTLALGVFIAGCSPGLAYPPLSDAVLRLMERPDQSRAYAVINAGTSIGVILAGPIALLAADQWRTAWLAFAAVALIATVWNGFLLPTGAYGGSAAQVPRLCMKWFRREGAGLLFLSAGFFGAVTSVYWTFAVDFIAEFDPMSDMRAKLFWVVIGVFGILGAAAGDLVGRFGLRRVFRVASLAVPLATLALLLDPGGTLGPFVSGALFGGAFILVTGLYGIWSMHVFQDRPSAGFGATFFLISAGQMVGPIIGGVVADHFGLVLTFTLALLLSLGGLLLGPQKDIRAILA